MGFLRWVFERDDVRTSMTMLARVLCAEHAAA